RAVPCTRSRGGVSRTGFFFRAEDGIRDFHVTGVQTCALPIWPDASAGLRPAPRPRAGPRGPGDAAQRRVGGPDRGLARRPASVRRRREPVRRFWRSVHGARWADDPGAAVRVPAVGGRGGVHGVGVVIRGAWGGAVVLLAPVLSCGEVRLVDPRVDGVPASGVVVDVGIHGWSGGTRLEFQGYVYGYEGFGTERVVRYLDAGSMA